MSPNVTAIQFTADGMKATVTSSHSPSTPVGTEMTTTGEAVFTISTNQSSWNVTQPADSWVTVIKEGNTFKVKAEKNISTNGRTPVRITITAGNATSLTLDIIQPAAEPEISIDPLVSKVLFSSDGKTATVASVPDGSTTSVGDVLTGEYQAKFTINANQPGWKHEKVPDDESSSWLIINITGSDEITFSAAENNSEEPRANVAVRFTVGSSPVYPLTFGQFGANLQPAQVVTLVPQITGTVFGTKSVVIGGDIINEGVPAYTSRGICWSTSEEPTTSDQTTLVPGTGTGRYTNEINFAPGTYYTRAFVINAAGTAYGLPESVTVPEPLAMPVIYTTEPADVQVNSAVLGGNIETVGTPEYTERGVCWATWQYPNIDYGNKQEIAGIGTGSFSTTVHGLQHNTDYYVRAYAINETGVSYGDMRVFTTKDMQHWLPALETVSYSNVGVSSAIVAGNITDAGYPEYEYRGFCFGATEQPTTSDRKVLVSGAGTGYFSVMLEELVPGITWYVRAYAINGAGTSYGNQISFTTLQEAIWPVFITSEAVEITSNSAHLSGNVTNVGSPAYTERGLCYSTSQTPTVNDTRLIATGSGTGGYAIKATGLSAGTTYYVRAYLVYDGNPTYGNQIEFTTTSGNLPVLTTLEVTNLSTDRATMGGNISDTGTPPYTERGICWGTGAEPTINNNKDIIEGTGVGSFNKHVQGLTPGTTYYVRAYAINASGCAYGNTVSFPTPSETRAPALATLAPVNVSSNSATLRVNITDIGIPPYSTRGVCYSTNRNPTTSDRKYSIITKMPTTGTYPMTASKLIPSTTYYARAFVIAGDVTYYGNEISFTTQSTHSPVTLTGPSTVYGNFDLTWSFTWPEIGQTDDHYEIEYSSDQGGTWEKLAIYDYEDRTSPFTDQIIVDASDVGNTYLFRVRAYAAGTYTDYSNTVTVYVAAANASTEANPARVNIIRYQQQNQSVAYQASSNPGTLRIGRDHTFIDYGGASYSDISDFQCLLYFDVNRDINGKSIKKATLSLYASRLADVKTHSVQVGMIVSNWNSSVNYNTRPQHYIQPEVIKPHPTSTGAWEVDITDIVRLWANGTRSNFGIVLWDPSTYRPYSTVDFSTVFSNSAGREPVLLIEYN